MATKEDMATKGIPVRSKTWDGLKKIEKPPFWQPHSPLCYLPPIWEIIIHREIDPEEIVEIGSELEPAPLSSIAIEEHMTMKIDMVKNLVEAGKLDAKIGNMAINHYETHIKEQKALK